MKKTLLLTLLISLTFINAYAKETKQDAKSQANTYELLNLFGEVMESTKEVYVEEVSDKKLIEAAINGMLSSLDPHSSFLDEKDFKYMTEQTQGKFGGLGIEVTMENGVVKVVSPIDDTPAFKAGIKSGDYITHLDETSVIGMTLNEAVEKMRGKVGKKIKLTIARKNEKPFDVTIKREEIKIKSVKSDQKDDGIFYIRISSFNEETDKMIQEAYKKQSKKEKITGIVLDLRNNPGGLLDQAVSVSDLFLEQGEIVSTRSKKPEDTIKFNAKAGDITNGLPIVVLINDGSASAAEIVAGALQDHKRAIIIGKKSFGKGSVQTVAALGKYGAMKITTARYYTPSGRSIQAKGIEPDIIVEQAKLETLDPIYTRSEAELSNALKNESNEDSKTKEKEKIEDYQLLRAVDLVKALSLYNKGDSIAK